MDYYIYENWTAEGHKAKIHFSDCGFCNNGKGIHPGSGDENGRWHGPVYKFYEAREAARLTGGTVSECGHCRPS